MTMPRVSKVVVTSPQVISTESRRMALLLPGLTAPDTAVAGPLIDGSCAVQASPALHRAAIPGLEPPCPPWPTHQSWPLRRRTAVPGRY
jgi:hypothetical protein